MFFKEHPLKTEFVRIDYENRKTATATTEQHREAIAAYAAKGYHYAGFVPVTFGPSGKMLCIDLVFEKDE